MWITGYIIGGSTLERLAVGQVIVACQKTAGKQFHKACSGGSHELKLKECKDLAFHSLVLEGLIVTLNKAIHFTVARHKRFRAFNLSRNMYADERNQLQFVRPNGIEINETVQIIDCLKRYTYIYILLYTLSS